MSIILKGEWVGRMGWVGGVIDCTSYFYNSEFYYENQKKIFCINVNKNARE